MALDHSEFLPTARRLAADWRILLWDMPGHGESQPAPPQFSVAIMADALTGLIDHLKIDNAVLLGFSFGGMVGQLVAHRRPGLCRAIIAYGCFMPLVVAPMPGMRIMTPLVIAGLKMQSWPAIKAAFVQRCALTNSARIIISSLVDRIGKREFIAMTNALMTAEGPDPSFHLACPVLLIRGDSDTNKNGLERSWKAFGATHDAADTIIIANAGHCAHLDQPQAFDDAIVAWLARFAAG